MIRNYRLMCDEMIVSIQSRQRTIAKVTTMMDVGQVNEVMLRDLRCLQSRRCRYQIQIGWGKKQKGVRPKP